MTKAPRAYFVGERRYTPSQFRRLSRARKIEGMVEWFKSNFEDPANQVSYETREGGYLWGGSGPHDADEELQDQFSDLATYCEIQAAVEEVQSDGTYEWTSSNFFHEPDDEPEDGSDEYEHGSVDSPPLDFSFNFERADDGVASGEVADGDGDWPPIIGVPVEERDLQFEVLSALDRFEAKLDAYAAQRAHRSHNHPPGLVEDDALSDEEIAAGRRGAADIREGIAKEPPDALIIARAALFIADIGKKLWAEVKTVSSDVRGGIIGGVAYAYHEELAGPATKSWGQNCFWCVGTG